LKVVVSIPKAVLQNSFVFKQNLPSPQKKKTPLAFPVRPAKAANPAHAKSLV